MRAEVTVAFHDKYDGTLYRIGDTFEGADERVIELADGGFVLPLYEEAPKPKPKRTTRKRTPKE